MKKRELVSIARNHMAVPAVNFPLRQTSAASSERRSPLGWLVGPGADFVVGLFPGDSEEFQSADDALGQPRRA